MSTIKGVGSEEPATVRDETASADDASPTTREEAGDADRSTARSEGTSTGDSSSATVPGASKGDASTAPASEAAPAAGGDDSEPELSTDDPWIGQVVADKYQIVGRLGVGGMAVVYEAENTTIHKRVALKLVDPSQPHGTELAARFAREVEASAKVEHPNVVAAFDGGKLPSGEAFLVSQLVRGESLHERLERGGIPWREAAAITAQIADALSAIHAAGFVHRDLTPSNVLLVPGKVEPHVFVLDLGIAAPIAGKDKPRLTSAFQTTVGTSVGTPGYMSPEQALGKSVDPRSDLYVLGLLFFEMLTGQPILDSELALTSMVTQQLQNDLKLPPPGETKIPPALDAMARELLAVEPDGRPTDAAAVRWAFKSWASGSAEPASSRSVVDSAKAIGASMISGGRDAIAKAAPVIRERSRTLREEALDFVDRVRERRASRRELGIAAGVLAVAILSCVGLGYVVSGGGEEASAVADGGAGPAADGEGEGGGGGGLAALLGVGDGASGEEGPITVTLSPTEDELLNGRTRTIREGAAGTILSAEDGTYPRYARLVAVLTLARSCEAKLAQVEAIASLGDVRAMPALERLDGTPRRGCGRRSREDCNACLRDTLSTAMSTLSASGSISSE